MRENKGITMVVLVITIVLLLILAGISIGQGNKVIKVSQLENIKTNMLLIKVKGKEYVENANFKLGTNFETATNQEERIAAAKGELKGTEIENANEFSGNIGITEEQFQENKANLSFYYRLSTQDLTNIGLSNVESDDSNGWYIIKYDIKNLEIEIYNTSGFENDGSKYYSLTELQNINL